MDSFDSLDEGIRSLWSQIMATNEYTVWPALIMWLNRVEKIRVSHSSSHPVSLQSSLEERQLASLYRSLCISIKDFFQSKGYFLDNGTENYLNLSYHTELYLSKTRTFLAS